MPTFTVSIKNIDAFKRFYSKGIEIVAADLAALDIAYADVEAKYQALTTGALRRSSTSVLMDVGTGDPTSGSNRDVGATFIGMTADGDAVVLKVASFDITKVDANGNVDMDDEDVGAFLALFKDGGPCTLSDGEKVATWEKGTLDK